MSDSRNNPPGGDGPHLRLVGFEAEPIESPQREDAARQFAHELSNLLDGAMRNLSLVMSRIDEHEAADADEDAVMRLRTANDGMRQMARLLHTWMRTGVNDPAQIYWQRSTFGDAVDYAMKMIGPAAESANIRVELNVDQTVRDLPAGPMYPVLANALQNAVEAIGRDGWIGVRAVCDDDTVTLTIEDNGPGLHADLPRRDDGSARIGATSKPTGHGIGLAVSQQIIDSLEGTLKLTNRETGGAKLTVTWPRPAFNDER